MVTFSVAVASSINDTANGFTPNESLSINIYYYYIYRNSIEVLSVQRRQKSNDFRCMVVVEVALFRHSPPHLLSIYWARCCASTENKTTDNRTTSIACEHWKGVNGVPFIVMAFGRFLSIVWCLLLMCNLSVPIHRIWLFSLLEFLLVSPHIDRNEIEMEKNKRKSTCGHAIRAKDYRKTVERIFDVRSSDPDG